MAQSSNLLLPYLSAAQAGKDVTHNEALRLLDGLVHLSVASADWTAPPADPDDGVRFIVPSGATGDWSGWDGDVAYFVDGAWLRVPAREGFTAWLRDKSRLVAWDGSAWINAATAGGLDELQNMRFLGVGTTADENNPFSAKINAALWTALPQSEGGSGNLWYTLNKESTGDDAGFNFQTGYTTHVQFGLFGTDDFRLAVSADGGTFRDAMRIDRTTGEVAFPNGLGQPALCAYKVSSLELGPNWQRLGDWDGAHVDNSSSPAFSWSQSDGDVYAGEDGIFLVSYSVSTNISGGNARSDSRVKLQKYDGSGWVNVPGAQHRMYNRNELQGGTNASWTGLVPLSVGEGLRIMVSEENASDTVVVDQATFMLYRL